MFSVTVSVGANGGEAGEGSQATTVDKRVKISVGAHTDVGSENGSGDEADKKKRHGFGVQEVKDPTQPAKALAFAKSGDVAVIFLYIGVHEFTLLS